MSQRRVAEIEAALAVPTISPRERKRYVAELKVLDPSFDYDAYVAAGPVTPPDPDDAIDGSREVPGRRPEPEPNDEE